MLTCIGEKHPIKLYNIIYWIDKSNKSLKCPCYYHTFSKAIHNLLLVLWLVTTFKGKR